MKNPLAVFTGLALASLAGLVVVTMERPPNSASEKLASGETPTVAEQPAMKTTQPAETAKLPEAKTPEETAGGKMASTETQPAGTVPETSGAGTKPVDNSTAAEAAKDSLKSIDPAKKPEFDTVRVESDGTAIVAGQAKPGTQVTLKLDGAEIGKGMANAEGAWVVIPDTPLPSGSHEITAEQKDGEAAPVVSDQSVAVAVSADGKKAPMIAVLEPGQAAKVLNSGTQDNAGQVAANQQPSTSSEQTNQTQQQQASTEAAKPQAETETVGKSTEQQAALKAGQAKKPELLSLDGVDYSASGDIIFSGRATSGTAVRLYVDSQPVGDAIVSGAGSWSFSGQQSISPGKHSLRADQIDVTGKVVARIELPFLREESSRVIALNESDSAVESPSTGTDKTDKSASAEQQKVEPPAVEQKQTGTETSSGESQSQPGTAVQSQAAKIPEADSSQAGEQSAKAPVAESSKAAGETLAPSQTEGSKPETTIEMSKTTPAPESTAEKPAAPAEQAKLTTEPKAQADAGAAASESKEPVKPRSGRVVIQPHNNLWKLSRVIYGRGAHYRMIYSANKDQIRNPNRIYPGQIFTIPNASPPESIDPKRKEPLTADEGAGTVE